MSYQTPLSKLADHLHIKREAMNQVSVIDATCTAANQRIEQLEKSLKDRPKHCEYMDEDGDINIEKYLTDVNLWAFHVRRVLAIKEQQLINEVA
jgi:hypothetical protein